MSLKKALDEKAYDVRLVDKHVGEGQFTQADVEKKLKQLVDDQGNLTTTEKSRTPVPTNSDLD